MRLESRSVRQVNGMRRDVIDRGKIVEPQRRKIWPSAIWSERRKCHTRWQQVRKLLQQRAIIGLSSCSGGLRFEARFDRARPGKRHDSNNRQWRGLVG